MQDPYPLVPFPTPIQAEITVPGSKSYTNRALLIAALAEGESVLENALFSDDTDRMSDSLRRLGFSVQADPAAYCFRVQGEGGRIPAIEAVLDTGNSGTTARSLLALLALGSGRYRLDGDARMRERPIQPLIQALADLGAHVHAVEGNGCPPVEIQACGLAGGEVTMCGSQSSQYFTALMLIAPVTRDGLQIRVAGELVSKPYLDLTADVMAAFGARAERDPNWRWIHIAGRQGYRARRYGIEPDASNASYFFAAAALTGGQVRVRNLSAESQQGDLAFLDVLEAMGCRVERRPAEIVVTGPGQLRGIAVDANAFSDTAQTLYGMAPFLAGPLEVRGVEHSRHQECDRISAAVTELRRLGQSVEEFPDGLRVTPQPVRPATVQTYQDHRMAMGFSLVGLRVPGIAIADPGCTAKTFPDYWRRLEALRPS
ncbi:MAG: 3-phosphoshikimate 1-carboxyvinyltransferase [Armatimonadetes bacterium]|nr:3-phosphoshikimate 1-carboxyvinyltransferase [Armatimonadota bacterium]